jgi:hypothetical protein
LARQVQDLADCRERRQGGIGITGTALNPLSKLVLPRILGPLCVSAVTNPAADGDLIVQNKANFVRASEKASTLWQKEL